MFNVLIALGSNHQQAAHIRWASQRLSTLLSDVRFSPTLWTQDIHGAGIYYMNRLAAGTTTLPLDKLEHTLKAIEAETGRTRQHVTIDLDVMQYDGVRHHLNDWPRPYIQRLLHTLPFHP